MRVSNEEKSTRVDERPARLNGAGDHHPEKLNADEVILSLMRDGATDDEVATEIKRFVTAGQLRIGDQPNAAKLAKLRKGLNGKAGAMSAKPRAAGPREPTDAISDAVTFLQRYHETAKGRDGVFVLGTVSPAEEREDPKRPGKMKAAPYRAQKIKVGDVEGMAREAVARSECANVYFGPHLMPKALGSREGDKKGSRGKEVDIIVQLSAVVDHDHDNAKPAIKPAMEPTFIVETCRIPAVNQHWHFVYSRALGREEAVALAELLHRKCGGDSGTGDITHVWRVPGTLNHPNRVKVEERGRPKEPQPVKLVGGTMQPVDPDEFRRVLESMPDLVPADGRPKSKTSKLNGATPPPSAEDVAGIDVAALLKKCDEKLVKMMGSEGQDRSKHSFATMNRLFDAGFADAEVTALAMADGAVFADKYLSGGRQALDDEIARVREKWTAAEEEKKAQGGAAQQGNTKADALIAAALAEGVVLYHAPDGTAFADTVVGEHIETWAIRSSAFKRWLRRIFYTKIGGAPGAETLEAAVGVLEAKAQFDGGEKPVYLRCAQHEGKIYIDLCDSDWQMIEVSPDGWRLIKAAEAPCRFRRSSHGVLALPEPKRGGTLDALKKHLNTSSHPDFILAVSWILAALQGRGPYPILSFAGEQGTGKTTACRILRGLVDPYKAPVRAMPKDKRDLAVTANNSHVVGVDNLSGISAEMSDALCSLSTGGGFSTRGLYSNDEEHIFEATRPIILNGIDDVATRGDLADRTLLVTLKPITDSKRRTEKALWRAFEGDAPFIFGAVLDALAHGLKHLPTTKIDRLPRMADYALWIAACEGSIWKRGEHMKVYAKNRNDAAEIVLDADSVAAALRQHMQGRSSTTTDITSLLSTLSGLAPDHVKKGPSWPQTPRGLSSRLKRLAPALRSVGITITDAPKDTTTRRAMLHITQGDPQIGPEEASDASKLRNGDNSEELQGLGSEALPEALGVAQPGQCFGNGSGGERNPGEDDEPYDEHSEALGSSEASMLRNASELTH